MSALATLSPLAADVAALACLILVGLAFGILTKTL
jgi:hypothetical protein